MTIHPIKGSFTAWALTHVIEMKNLSEDNRYISKAKTVAAGISYMILPLVAIVELVFRGIIAILATLASYCSSNPNVASCANHLRWSTRATGMSGAMSVVAFVWNITREKIDIRDLANTATCTKGEIEVQLDGVHINPEGEIEVQLDSIFLDSTDLSLSQF